MLLKREQDLKLQKLRDFKTILAAIHLFFKIVINLKLIEGGGEIFNISGNGGEPYMGRLDILLGDLITT